MRILIAHSFYRVPGGEDSYVSRQVQLLKRSHDVEVFARRNEDLSVGIATAAGMAYSFGRKKAAEAAIRRFKPDIVHIHNIYPGLGPAVHLAAEAEGVPAVMTVHNFRLRCPNGYMFTEGNLCRRCETGVYAHAVIHRCFPARTQGLAYAGALFFHRFGLSLENKLDLFIAPSHFMRSRLLHWGIPEEKTRTIRHFVDPSQQPAAAIGRFGIYVGRLSTEKGLNLLLEALALAGDPPFKIVGDGPELQSLLEAARNLGLRRTTFPGRLSQDAVRNQLREARFAVMVTLSEENAPLAAIEAMMEGRPLLVTRMGGLPELVSSGAGLECRAGDVNELASKLRTMFADDDLCARAGARALETAMVEFHPNRHLERLESAYSEVLARRGPERIAREGPERE